MRTSLFFVLLFLALCLAGAADSHASGSMLRVSCGEAVGAEVFINKKFKGECPLDIQLLEGAYKLRVVKTVDASTEMVFEQDVRIGDGTIKKIEAELSAPRLNAVAQKREDARLALESAEAAKRDAQQRAEAKAAFVLESAAAANRDAQTRAQFKAALADGTIQASFRDCPDCPEMVAIRPGSFEMGSNNGADDEKPVHRVNISYSFAISKTEVTQEQWRAVMGNNPSNYAKCGDNCPVEQVSWDDAKAFIEKLNASTGKQYRLPSEAEWEYACRAGARQEYCGSDDVNSVAWYGAYATPVGNSGKTTNMVAGKQANAFGLYDMSGNVWEWVEDSYHDSYAAAPADGSAWQGYSARRVLRGGTWDRKPQFARAAFRVGGDRAYRCFSCGFRLARMLP